jgi:hypothetical protein
MRLNVLTESTTLSESPFDIKALFTIHSNENSLNSDFNPDITREYIKSLNVDKVTQAVSASRPYITTFFKAVLDRKYEDVLDVLYSIAAMLVGPFSNNSPIVEEFKPALSIGSTYFDAVNKFLEFYRQIEGDSSIVLRKVKAIYDRFKDNRAKVLDGLFTVYEEYLNTLDEGKETAKSRKVKQKLYSVYVMKQNLIEDVLDEVASLSPMKTEDSPLKQIVGKNYDVVRSFFEENRGDVKKIAGKLLYLAYLDELLKNEQGSQYSISKYSKFTGKKDKNSITSNLKLELGNEIDAEFQVTLNNDGFTVSIPTISSIDFEKAANAIKSHGESGVVKLYFLNMNQEIRNVPQYAFYYAYDKVFGTKNLILHASKLLDIESVKNASSILVNQPMPEDFDLGEYSFSIEGNSVVSSNISILDLTKAMQYIKVFAILKDFSLNEYEEEVFSLVKRLEKNPDVSFPIDDLLKTVRKNKGSSINLMTYELLKNALKNPEYYDDVVYVLAYVAYDAIMNGVELNKLFFQLFKKVLVNNQDDIIFGMIRKTKGDQDKLAKVKEFLLEYKKLLTAESLATLGVTDNVE